MLQLSLFVNVTVFLLWEFLLYLLTLAYVSVFQGSPRGGNQHELGGLVWEDVEGQESFPVSVGFELTTQGLLVQERNYSATTHTQCDSINY